MKKINSEKASEILGGTEYWHSQTYDLPVGVCDFTLYRVTRTGADKHGNGGWVTLQPLSNSRKQSTRAACPDKEWTTFS